jgi:hypothetical protein
LQAKQAEVKSTIDEWKAQKEQDKLLARANRAEEYAASAIIFAAAAIDEAELATLEAVEARLMADAATAETA